MNAQQKDVPCSQNLKEFLGLLKRPSVSGREFEKLYRCFTKLGRRYLPNVREFCLPPPHGETYHACPFCRATNLGIRFEFRGKEFHSAVLCKSCGDQGPKCRSWGDVFSAWTSRYPIPDHAG